MVFNISTLILNIAFSFGLGWLVRTAQLKYKVKHLICPKCGKTGMYATKYGYYHAGCGGNIKSDRI